MNIRILYILSLIIISFLVVKSKAMGIPGGWSIIENAFNDEGVIKVINSIINTKFNSKIPRYNILSAKKQVVAGLAYEVKVEIFADESCSVHIFKIWDHFGTIKLMEESAITEGCE